MQLSLVDIRCQILQFSRRFLIDPKITSLGKKIKEKLSITPREIAREYFVKSVIIFQDLQKNIK